MRARSTLIVLVIAMAVGAYIYFVERKQPTTEERQEKEKKLLAIGQDDVAKLVIERNGETIICEKQDGEWFLRKPLAVKAEKSEVERVLSRLQWAEVERRLEASEEQPLVLDDYGLGKPRIRLEVWVKEDDSPQELRFGAEAAAGGNVYCMVGDEQDVLLVRKGLYDVLSSPVRDLRSKTVVELETGAVEKLELGKRKATLVVAKNGGAWRIVTPLSARADAEKVEKLLAGLAGLKVEEFVSEDSTQVVEYGLDDPRLAAIAWQGDGAKTVLFGKKVEGRDEVYCMRRESDSIYTVRDTILKELDVSPGDLRDRKLLRVGASDKLQSVEIISQGREIALARTGEEGWQITRPVTAKGDSAAVDGLVDWLERVEAEDFVAEVSKAKDLKRYGLLEPALLVRLVGAGGSGEEQQVTELLFGKKKKDSCYAKRSDEPSVVLVGADILELTDRDVLQYRSRQVFSFEQDDAREIRVRNGAKTVTVRRGGGRNWYVHEPAGLEADEDAVRGILWDLYDLRADALVEEASVDARQRYGLANPKLEVKITVGGDDSTQVYVLSVGERSEGGSIYAAAEGGEADDFIFEVADFVVGDLQKTLVRESQEEQEKGGE